MGLADFAARWAASEDREETDDAYDEQRAEAKKKKVRATDEESEEEEQISDDVAEELAEDLWNFVDELATGYGGKKYAQGERDKLILHTATAPLMKKYAPVDGIAGLLNSIGPEWIFLGAVVVVYGPKHFGEDELSEEEKQKKAAAGGDPEAKEKKVNGEVTERRIRAVP